MKSKKTIKEVLFVDKEFNSSPRTSLKLLNKNSTNKKYIVASHLDDLCMSYLPNKKLKNRNYFSDASPNEEFYLLDLLREEYGLSPINPVIKDAQSPSYLKRLVDKGFLKINDKKYYFEDTSLKSFLVWRFF